jgi:outer membrane protein TolC
MSDRIRCGPTPRRVVRRPGAGPVVVACSLVLAACAGPGQASHRRALEQALLRSEPSASTASAAAADPWRGLALLERGRLVQEVLRRNPTLAAARSAWRAALARYPQETAFDDPMVGYTVAPRALAGRAAPLGNMVELSQPIPFPGKLALRGEAALDAAEAAGHEFEAERLRLATLASLLFDRWYETARAIEINADHRVLVDQLHRSALARYAAGTADAQDALAAELESAELLHQSVELESDHGVVAAQIDALLHLPADHPVPPPPAALPLPERREGAEGDWLAEALATRPDLAAARSRIERGEAEVALARREFLPDFRLKAAYDGRMDMPELRPQVGLELNLPLQLGRRRAALQQAQAELDRERSEAARVEDQVRVDVRTGALRLHEAWHGLEIARDRMLPAARDRLAAARAAFESGERPFSELLDAERRLRDVELEVEQAATRVTRRAAELEGAVGRIPDLP